MTKIYARTENGTTTHVPADVALREAHAAQTDRVSDRAFVRRFYPTPLGGYDITYTDGRHVSLVPEQPEPTKRRRPGRKLSDVMITAMLDALTRALPTPEGPVYQLSARHSTIEALRSRGHAANETWLITPENGQPYQATGTYLTPRAITFLTEALTYVLSKTDGSFTPYRAWLATPEHARLAAALTTDTGPATPDTACEPAHEQPQTSAASHTYTWADLREIPATDLAPGDVFVKPATGIAYTASSDGTVRGAGVAFAMAFEGVAWTVLKREGNTHTCRSVNGDTITAVALPAHKALRVITDIAPGQRYTVKERVHGDRVSWTIMRGHVVTGTATARANTDGSPLDLMPLRKAVAASARVPLDRVRPIATRADTGYAPRTWETTEDSGTPHLF